MKDKDDPIPFNEAWFRTFLTILGSIAEFRGTPYDYVDFAFNFTETAIFELQKGRIVELDIGYYAQMGIPPPEGIDEPRPV